jgi:hypothetical protein
LKVIELHILLCNAVPVYDAKSLQMLPSEMASHNFVPCRSLRSMSNAIKYVEICPNTSLYADEYNAIIPAPDPGGMLYLLVYVEILQCTGLSIRLQNLSSHRWKLDATIMPIRERLTPYLMSIHHRLRCTESFIKVLNTKPIKKWEKSTWLMEVVVHCGPI